MIYKVYVKTDEKNRIIAVDSSGFINNPTNWELIDEGSGDRFYLAQAYYFGKGLMDDRGIYRYELDDGKAVERTKEEMDADWEEPEPGNSLEERVTVLEEKVDGEMADQQAALNLLGVYA